MIDHVGAIHNEFKNRFGEFTTEEKINVAEELKKLAERLEECLKNNEDHTLLVMKILETAVLMARDVNENHEMETHEHVSSEATQSEGEIVENEIEKLPFVIMKVNKLDETPIASYNNLLEAIQNVDKYGADADHISKIDWETGKSRVVFKRALY